MAEEQEQQEKKRKNSLLLFIILTVVLVATSIGGTIFFMSGSSEEQEEEGVAEEIKPAALYFALNPKFQTNYDVNGRHRLFQLSVALMTRDQEVIDALAMHSPTIKSKLVILLSGQKFDMLGTAEGREQLRQQCLEAVQEILKTEIGKPGIEKVLFTDFVMQ